MPITMISQCTPMMAHKALEGYEWEPSPYNGETGPVTEAEEDAQRLGFTLQAALEDLLNEEYWPANYGCEEELLAVINKYNP